MPPSSRPVCDSPQFLPGPPPDLEEEKFFYGKQWFWRREKLTVVCRPHRPLWRQRRAGGHAEEYANPPHLRETTAGDLHMLTDHRRRVEERPPQPPREAQPLKEGMGHARRDGRLASTMFT